MLEALKSGDIKKITKYEDIYATEIDEFINIELPKAELNEKIKALQIVKKKQEEDYKNDIKEEAILKLIELDIKPNKAKEVVQTVLKKNNSISVNELVKKAFKIIIEDEQVKENSKRKVEKSTDREDLRNLVMSGKKENKPAYEILKENGYIKNVSIDSLKVV